MINRYLLYLAIYVSVAACAHIETIETVRREPYKNIAIRNYLPESVRPQPAYTIYDGSEWNCGYTTRNNGDVCCLTTFGTMSPWKYCLLVDQEGNGLGFIELGTNQALMWPEGKQRLFKNTSK